jgi:hypothetical protein
VFGLGRIKLECILLFSEAVMESGVYILQVYIKQYLKLLSELYSIILGFIRGFEHVTMPTVSTGIQDIYLLSNCHFIIW